MYQTAPGGIPGPSTFPAGISGGVVTSSGNYHSAMRPAQPSRTAYRVALLRAAHQLLDGPPVLLDPLAIPILRPEDADALRSDPARFDRGAWVRHLRAFMAVRARFAEDQLAHARAAGIRQYVILGAGLDTSAYRDPTPDLPLLTWEVDHPSTQAWKRRRLAEAGVAVPDRHSFVAVDFERQELAAALAGAGFDPGAGAVFSWLGVTYYLTRTAIHSTLGYVAKVTRAGGGVTFDYGLAPSTLSISRRLAYALIAARVRALGEPWRSSFVPDALVAELRRLGFAVAQDVGPEVLNEHYLASRADGLTVGDMAHLMWAGAAPHST